MVQTANSTVAEKSIINTLHKATEVCSVLLTPFVISAAGFTSGGIAAGSIASGMMSSAAVANGGGVASGSLVAILQSFGAAGLTKAATAAVASTGAVVGGTAGWVARMLFR